MKALLIGWVYASVPVGLFGLGWMGKLLYEAATTWQFFAIIIALITCFLGVAALIDESRKKSGLPPL